jgi:hypothetical protein
MKKLSALFIFLACLLSIGCNKREYPPEKVKHGEEDIFFSGTVDQQPVNLQIGTEGYYCYSSFMQSNDGLYFFHGELKKYDCNPCPMALRVELSDYRQRIQGTMVQVDSTFRLGSRGIIPGLAKAPALKFEAYSNKDISSMRWDFSNGISSTSSVTTCEFGQPGPQTASLTLKTVGNCESTIISKIFVTKEGNVFASSIKTGTVLNNTAEFIANVTGGKLPYTYSWNFGDGDISDLPSPSHIYKYAGGYPVKLVVRDAENKICESNYLYVSGSDRSSCALNMTVSDAGSRNAFLDGARIQWTDKSVISK